jgi:hypothetical protein
VRVDQQPHETVERHRRPDLTYRPETQVAGVEIGGDALEPNETICARRHTTRLLTQFWGCPTRADRPNFAGMTILRIQNKVKDFARWRAAFDAYADVRRRMNVRAYRVTRGVEDPQSVFVDLDFDSAQDARAFATFLTDRVWPTPRSQAALAEHYVPVLLEEVAAQ